MRRLLGLVIAVLFCLPVAAYATVTEYTTLASWEAAAGTPIVVEDFSDNSVAPGFSILDISFEWPSNKYPYNYSGNLQAYFGLGATSNWVYFSFSNGTNAFAADWDLSFWGYGSGILFEITYSDNTTEFASGPYGLTGFRGYVFDKQMTFVKMTTTFGQTERFFVDNIRFVGQAGQQVPEPATMLLFGAGLAGLFAGRRMLKR